MNKNFLIEICEKQSGMHLFRFLPVVFTDFELADRVKKLLEATGVYRSVSVTGVPANELPMDRVESAIGDSCCHLTGSRNIDLVEIYLATMGPFNGQYFFSKRGEAEVDGFLTVWNTQNGRTVMPSSMISKVNLEDL